MTKRSGAGPLEVSVFLRRARAAAIGVPAALLVAAACGPQAQADGSEVAEMLNRLRSPSSICAAAPGLRRVVRRPGLDQAAATMLGGAAFGESLQAVGYRVNSVKGFRFYGSLDSAVLGRLLAAEHCASITDALLAEIGVHQQGATTWVLLAKAFAPGAGLEEAATASLVLQLVNDLRAEARHCGDALHRGAGRVLWNDVLAQAARAHSEDMARNDYFDHASLDGSTPALRIKRAGYDSLATGENIAAGQLTAQEVVAAWRESPAHCRLLMDPEFTEMGVSLAVNLKSRHGVYWTQHFGAPRSKVRRKDRG